VRDLFLEVKEHIAVPRS